MSDSPKEAEKQIEKKIFISGDAWLCVFDLLPPRQLGLQIALISDRFDAMVKEHFKSRRRALEFIRIGHQIDEDGKMETQIVNAHGQPLPMPTETEPMPNKVIAFNGIVINYLDRNGMAFLEHFRRLFTTCGTLAIKTNCARLLDFILRNIPSTAGVHANSPSSAVAASDHQPLMLKWLCAPSPRSRDANILPPKMLSLDVDTEWTVTTINQIKAVRIFLMIHQQFVAIRRRPLLFAFSATRALNIDVFYGHWTNGRTGEQLIIERRADDYLLLVRCPISRDSDKWTTWENEAIGWFSDEPLHQLRNRIIVCMRDERSVGDGLLDNDDAAASDPGPSVQQQLQAESVYDDENEMNQDDDNDEEEDGADDNDDDNDDL
ncbi:hypothetical protein niasHT_032589 [Heterodera trifolii]|uniref:Uncharacterized protein n=1 Tax=Heterodera trifolii TaxID=157864 RepID=A0ABD2IJT0_9BILA